MKISFKQITKLIIYTYYTYALQIRIVKSGNQLSLVSIWSQLSQQSHSRRSRQCDIGSSLFHFEGCIYISHIKVQIGVHTLSDWSL